jgi:hypothetical protein
MVRTMNHAGLCMTPHNMFTLSLRRQRAQNCYLIRNTLDLFALYYISPIARNDAVTVNNDLERVWKNGVAA